MLILPLSHENMHAQRLPYITMGIVIINTLLFLISHHLMIPDNRESDERGWKLMEYYIERPYLEFPEDAYSMLPPGNQRQIDLWGGDEDTEGLSAANRQTALMRQVLKDMQSDQREEEDEEAAAKIRQKEQEVLNTLGQAFVESVEDIFSIKYGYVPARGGFFTIFSSIFLHGGYLHLIFNMLFLWLSGCNIEDLWGRVVYSVFYLLGGIFATLAHGWMSPDSMIPLIGASGAIAAVMGAFMVRMYDTKIYFVYFLFLGLRFKIGRFGAPAYVMLPLWFLQQLWEAFSSGSSSGVAFWAHIGGFVFGAIVAVLFKVTGFEENVLAPAIDKKVALVDEHLATGIEKLQEDDIDGAIQELKIALRNNPDDVIAHGELSKAYFKQGEQKLALREFKRAVFLHMKRGELAEAIDQYLELHAELPELMLDPPQQMKIASAIEQRAHKISGLYTDEEEARQKREEMYNQAASAYKKLIEYYQSGKESSNHSNAIKALTRYGDLNLSHLERPKDAWKAYQILMNSSRLSPDQKHKVEAKIQQAKKLVAEQAKKEKVAQTKKKMETYLAQKKTEQPQVKRPRRNIPIQKRLKLTPEADAPAKYQVASIAPHEANKVVPFEKGLDLKRISEPPLLFDNISVICVSQLQQPRQKPSPAKKSRKKDKKVAATTSIGSSQEVILADLFVAGESRPYRIASNRIAYPQFFSKLQKSSLDNFRQFILYIISNIDSVYVDQATVTFLNTGKPRTYPDQLELQIHEKIFWKQLKDALRFQCEQCGEVYWIDGARIPEKGAWTKCTKCGHQIHVKRVQKES